MLHLYGKKILLLIIILLPITIQGIKKKNVSKKKLILTTSQNKGIDCSSPLSIQREELLEKNLNRTIPFSHLSFHKLIESNRCRRKFLDSCNKSTKLNTCKQFNIDGYSCLGLIAMATYKVQKKGRWLTQELPYTQKDNYIGKLLKLGFKPTEKDKETSFVEKNERVRPKAYAISSLYKSNIYFLPSELTQYISYLALITEKNLF